MEEAKREIAAKNQSQSSKEVVIDGNKHPESATNAADAQKSGQPKTVNVGSKADKSKRRAEAMKGHPTVPGKDRDEYPPAWSAQGGRGATVKPSLQATTAGLVVQWEDN